MGGRGQIGIRDRLREGMGLRGLVFTAFEWMAWQFGGRNQFVARCGDGSFCA